MSLNPLKRIVKSALNKDPIQEIFWGNPTADIYNKAIYNYQLMPSDYKSEVINRVLRKMDKPKPSDMVIANLVLLHKIMKINIVCLPSTDPLIEQSKRKQLTCQKNFIKFYYSFLRNSQNQILNKKQNMENLIDYCQITLTKCFDIIKNNIVIDYLIAHSQNQVTIRIALRQIFEDIKNDLLYVTDFVEKNANLIYQDHNNISFALNQVYEKLIHLNKNFPKINVLIKKAGFSINLPVYQFNKDLNMKIQMQMNSRKDQKMKFKTEKQIKSQKNIELYEHQTMKHIEYSRENRNNQYQSLSEIQQDQIMIQYSQEVY